MNRPWYQSSPVSTQFASASATSVGELMKNGRISVPDASSQPTRSATRIAQPRREQEPAVGARRRAVAAVLGGEHRLGPAGPRCRGDVHPATCPDAHGNSRDSTSRMTALTIMTSAAITTTPAKTVAMSNWRAARTIM